MPETISRGEKSITNISEAGTRTIKIGGDRPIRVSTGHRILHHDGKCSRPHGHNYEITVTITGELSDEGWIVDKGVVTSIIDKWDHMFLVEKGDPLIEAFEQSGDENSLVILDHPPTAEVMAALLEDRMLQQFPENVDEVSVTVRETGELCSTQ